MTISYIRKSLATATALLLAATAGLTACSSDSDTSSDASGNSQAATSQSDSDTRVVQDGDGKDVTIPANVTKVAPTIGAMDAITAMLGSADKISATVKGVPDMFYTVYPQVKEAKEDTSSVEGIIASGAQVVYGVNRFTDDQLAQLESAGVVMVPISNLSTPEDIQKAVTIIGNILGGDAPEAATAFNDYYSGNISKSQDLSSGVDDPLSVLPLNYASGSWATVNSSDILSTYLDEAGAKNVAADYEGTKNGTRMSVTAEQILQWDPEALVVLDQASYDKVMSDPSLSTLSAVKNKRVYVQPSGVYLWSVRSAEGALEPLWLGSVLYPDKFADVDMNQEVRDFYQKFYDYELSDDELKTIMAGDE